MTRKNILEYPYNINGSDYVIELISGWQKNICEKKEIIKKIHKYEKKLNSLIESGNSSHDISEQKALLNDARNDLDTTDKLIQLSEKKLREHDIDPKQIRSPNYEECRLLRKPQRRSSMSNIDNLFESKKRQLTTPYPPMEIEYIKNLREKYEPFRNNRNLENYKVYTSPTASSISPMASSNFKYLSSPKFPDPFITPHDEFFKNQQDIFSSERANNDSSSPKNDKVPQKLSSQRNHQNSPRRTSLPDIELRELQRKKMIEEKSEFSEPSKKKKRNSKKKTKKRRY